MTQPDHDDRAPGMGDPTRSDDVAIPGLRTGGPGAAGSSPGGGEVHGPAPAAGDPDEHRPDAEPGHSGHQGGQLGAAGGGYGSASGEGTAGVGPDGHDAQVMSGPGPQTDWLRSAGGGTVSRPDDPGA